MLAEASAGFDSTEEFINKSTKDIWAQEKISLEEYF